MLPKTKHSRHTILFPIFFLIGIGLYAAINAWNLIFTDLNQTSLNASFSQIHFESPGNSFGGGIFWLPVKSQNPVNIKIHGNASDPGKTCTNQVRGFYYNDARGSRLWPLDLDSLQILKAGNSSYNILSLTGGFYTTCSAYNDKYSIYGYIQYTLAGTPVTTSYIIAGVTMNYHSNSYGNQFKDGFQYFNNKTPLGYIWDSIGGIGFVGGEISGSAELIAYINSGGSINSAFSLTSGNILINQTDSWGFDSATTGNAEGLKWSYLIQGNAILSKAISIYEKGNLLDNLDKRTILISSSDINSATVINIAKKNTESLCRGKYQTITTPQQAITSSTQTNIVCYENSPKLTLNLNGHDDELKGKTIILKNSDLALKGNMDMNTPPLDIFIDGGNLYIDPVGGNKTNFNIQGFPTAIGSGVNQGIYLKGNIIINGLIIGGSPGSEKDIPNKTHLQGKFVSLNSVGVPSQGRVQQIDDILEPNTFTNWISLSNIFTWYCNPFTNKGATDNADCNGTEKIVGVPFVILDDTFPSQIIK